ncbi:MAG: rhomboid family intramembrane serine protease [Syntrophales bacterium]|nr:rhomboid family intramembrane serine protease [Syntrophales bacterium]
MPSRVFMQPGKGIIDPVQTIIYTNVVIYIVSLLINPSALTASFHPLLFLSPTDESLFLLGATGTLPIDQFGRWWTLISASYLHGGILHLLFNMVAFYQLGPFILLEFGAYRLFIIYTLSGVGGFLVSYLVGIPFTIGASAAICGLIGAILYFGKSRGGFYGESIYRQAMGWVVGLILFGLLLPGINNWAHGGGLLSGVVVSFLLGYEEKRRENILHRLLAWVLFLITVFVIGGNLLRLVFFLLGA